MLWEDTFKSWGAPPGTTEQQKMENAEDAIRKAIKANVRLSKMDISIIRQGSYNARTNVRQHSDVDICVCLNSIFFRRYPEGKIQEHYGHSAGDISFIDYKNFVHTALDNYFGYRNITRGNKAFDVHSNTYRVDADVVPAFAYRFYQGEREDEYIQPAGIAFDPDKGERVINWPHHTHKNGNAKQERTGQRYKKMVRIVKKLRNTMQEEDIVAAMDIGSFQIESAVWNVPDEGFNHDTYEADVRYVLAHCFNKTLPRGDHENMREVNDLKVLFDAHQPWTREQANSFFSAAWDYVGFN